jgi:SAM-dependent methyltransferase
MIPTSPSLDHQIETALWYEQHRKELIAAKNTKAALETYRTQRDFFPDHNTGKFWDQKFSQPIYDYPMEQWRLKEIQRYIDGKKKLLNIGVGRGRLEEILAKRFPKLQYTGTDITRKTFRQLQKKHPRWKFQYAELTQLPFPAGSFDQVLCLEVLEHIRPNETFPVLKEIVRVLKRKGRAIISVPVNSDLEKLLPQNPNAQMRLYTPQMFCFELEHVGFKVEKLLSVTAFAQGFGWKNALNRIVHFRQPNGIIAVCRKGDE